MATGIIAPINKGTGDEYTLYGSLLKNGFHRAPGATLFLYPKREKDGSYRTGLDENAPYINRLPKEEREVEKARVKKWREICEEFYHVPLGPRDKFYTEMFLHKKDQEYCPVYKMNPRDQMMFDLDDPEELLVFAFLRVRSDFIAPSYDAYFLGQVEDPAKVSYYVKDEAIEASRSYKKNQEMNLAISGLQNASPQRQRSIARSLGLGITDNTAPEVVYNLLNDFIKQGVLEEGYFKGAKAVELFNRFMNMKDDNLKVFNDVSKALDNNIYRMDIDGIKKGSRLIGKTKEDAVTFLLSTKGQDDLLILQSELEQKSEVPVRARKVKVVDTNTDV